MTKPGWWASSPFFMELYEISFSNICKNSKCLLMIFIWFGYVMLLAATGFEMSTVSDADKYGLAYSPSMYPHV